MVVVFAQMRTNFRPNMIYFANSIPGKTLGPWKAESGYFVVGEVRNTDRVRGAETRRQTA